MNVNIRENPQSFLEIAEQSARSKKLDLVTDEYFAHSFLRNGPGSFKDGHEFAPDPENVDASIDRLASSLRIGLVSHEFARRAHLPMSRNWSDGNNMTYVSVTNYFQYAAIYGVYGYGVDAELPKDQLYTLILDKNIPIAQKDPLSEDASFVQRRIAPRFFRGLVVNDSFYDEDKLEETKMIMLGVYASNPSLAIPIYNGFGEIYWPKII